MPRSHRPHEVGVLPVADVGRHHRRHPERSASLASTNTPASAAPCSEPTLQPRSIEIRNNLTDRIAEAEREGWLGEIEGLKVSLAAVDAKLAQLDAQSARVQMAIDLGMPTFRDIAARSTEP